MTEDEAKTKACCGTPMLASAIILAGGSAGMQRSAVEELTGLLGHPPGNCRASACMAWQTKMRTEVRDRRNGSLIPPNTIVMRGETEKVSVPDGGYCGLAGSPAQ